MKKLLLIICVGFFILSGCARGEYRTVAGATWGTTYHITYKSAPDLNDSILHQMRLVDASLSPFNKESAVSRINRGDTLVSDLWFQEIFRLSQMACSISSGAFDPTISPLINIWGFGYKPGSDSMPSRDLIDSALSSVGILQCTLSPTGTLHKKSPTTEFNFSAIAKGFGVDRIAEMLERNGCHDYLVEIGGEMALAGKNPRGEDWRIQVDAPSTDATAHEQLTVLSLTDCCIATSGNYRNNHILGDSLVYHTISTRTGYPALTSTLSATIVAPTCALADALATSAMAMPADSAVAMLKALPEIRYLLVIGDSIKTNL